MLLRADQNDDDNQAFALWSAMIPFWNSEADRFRTAAHAATRARATNLGIVAEAEEVMSKVRGALLTCDTLVASATPGDRRLPLLLSAAAEFEALLESLHRSLDLMADYVRRPARTMSPGIVRQPAGLVLSEPL